LNLCRRPSRPTRLRAGATFTRYQKYFDRWYTAYDVKKLRSGFVWSDKFGWLPKAYFRRYEEGQRFYDGRWISAAEDEKLHRDIRSGGK